MEFGISINFPSHVILIDRIATPGFIGDRAVRITMLNKATGQTSTDVYANDLTAVKVGQMKERFKCFAPNLQIDWGRLFNRLCHSVEFLTEHKLP